MAILGFHVVICLIAVTIITKLVRRANFIDVFITNGEDEAVEGFSIPKSSPFQLSLYPVNVADLVQFEMYTQLHWMCLCIPVSLLVYTLSEIYNFVMPENKDFNVSIIFMLVVIMFVLQVLMTLSSYLVSSVDERGFMISIGAVYFLFAFIFAMNSHRIFDIQMLEAYDKLSTNIADFVESSGLFDNSTANIRDYRPTNPLMMYISLSVFFSMLSAMLVFPNFRCAMMYLKALEIDGRIRRAVDHVAFLLPAFILASFSKPLNPLNSQKPSKIEISSVTIEQLDIIRIYLLLFWVFTKFITRVSHLQAHLNLAYDKVAEMRAESGKVKNYTIQAMIYRYYRYLCCAAIQYFGPAILALLFALLLKTTGNLSWLGAPRGIENAELNTLALTGPIRFVFDTTICRAFFSFLLVVTLLINFSLQLLGVVYHSYFVGGTGTTTN
ncbi:Protein CBG19780 [Caenorhabditis briggsae]|uniref:Protein CBG19780 n=1 Tax=Caenorhabditis briggsae TaxID=6238 RepID=A8XWB9_CAEBR|nr:Protein CBG19780 [Caenorhabditis briggsae]CAP36938.2 Protein CBG19780 [Caenorhabditis briggsae]